MQREELELVRRLISGSHPLGPQDSSSNKYLLALIAQLANGQGASPSEDQRVSGGPSAQLAAPRPDPLAALSLLAGAQLARNGAPTPPTPVASKTTKEPDGGDVTSTVLKTMGLLTGVGPILTGVMSLFGGSGGKSEPAPLPVFTLPPSINVTAGLQSDRNISGVEHGTAGNLRTVATDSNTPAPTIQVNVQTMDSRSFLDHSSDIAAAVRRAMLQSNSLNDVVSEL